MRFESYLENMESDEEKVNGEDRVESSTYDKPNNQESKPLTLDRLLEKLDDVLNNYKVAKDFFSMGEEESAINVVSMCDETFDEVITLMRTEFGVSEDLISEYTSRRDSIVSPIRNLSSNKTL